MILTESQIRARLAQAYPSQIQPESPYPPNLLKAAAPQHAAVLITFLPKEDGWHLLFIRRSVMPHDQHSGQVAFPGGRCEPTDSDATTAALREAQEEVGLNPSDVRILGRVQDALTITNYQITPIVGIAPWPYLFVRQEAEVDHIFSIPLTWLAEPSHREIKMRGLKFLGRDVPVIYFRKYEGELLWGVSARITVLLLEALGLANSNQRYA